MRPLPLAVLTILMLSPTVASAAVGFHCDGDACYPSCGDGLVRGDEACDDGNVAMYDGCADDCTIEGLRASIETPSSVRAATGMAAPPRLRGAAPERTSPMRWALALAAVAHRRIR